jgi:acetoin utilization deacetylase AcuC-like enzyme
LRWASDHFASGRIAYVLEGGYDLDGLAGGMAAVLASLTEPAAARPPTPAPLPEPGTLARAAIDGTLAAHAAAGVAIPAPELP